jgi:serine/threonine protein kinase/predicted ATPase/Tfp pilus assembly protein PilF
MSLVHLHLDRLMPDAAETLTKDEEQHLNDCPICWYDAQVLRDVYGDSAADEITEAEAETEDGLSLTGILMSSGDDVTDVQAEGVMGTSPLVFDAMQLDRWVGNGLTGPVYKVFESETGTAYAAKVLNNVPTEPLQRIESQFERYRALSHRVLNTPARIDLESDVPIIMSPWVGGKTLDGWLGLDHLKVPDQATRERSQTDVFRVFIDVASALLTLHERGLVHGHLGPSKVLVTSQGRARIVEAGLWVRTATDGRRDPWREYLPPEEAEGGERTAAWDWYAFGMLLDLAARTTEVSPLLSELAGELTLEATHVRASGARAFAVLTDVLGTDIGHGRGGRYTDLGLLGQGGMGEVRRAHDPELRRTVALKSLKTDLRSNDEIASRFEAEAQIMAQLQHPGIVPIYEIAELADGRTYFSMQEIDGETLESVVSRLHSNSPVHEWSPVQGRNGARDWTFLRIVESIQRVCDAVSFAHDRGVIHRDLKPANIMLGAYGEVFVIDWGLAKVLSAPFESTDGSVDTKRTDGDSGTTQFGWIGGTPAFMAPEQAFGGSDGIDHRCDIYAIGAMLYHLLSGKAPYRGTSSADVIRQVRAGGPTPLDIAINGGDILEEGADETVEMTAARVPEELVELCEKAMSRDPDDRFQDAQALGAALAAWQEGAKQRRVAMAAYDEALEQRDLQRKALWDAVTLRAEAETLMDSLDGTEQRGWEIAEQATVARHRAEDHHFEYEQRLQVALAHAPNLVEAHRDLARIYLTAGNLALRAIDRRQLRRSKRLISAHLTHIAFDDALRPRLKAWVETATIEPTQSKRRQSPFVGRSRALAELKNASQRRGQVCPIVGAAGAGKSRLAREFLMELGPMFAGGTYLCDVADVTDEDELIQRTGEALDIPLTEGDPIETIAASLRGRGRIAVVFDDVDQLNASSQALIQQWSAVAPEAFVVTTGVQSPSHEDGHKVQVGSLSHLSGLELFESAARAVRPNFKLSDGNWRTVGKIVTQLDRLPLAIELAASRVGLLSVDELNARLTESFEVLGDAHTDGSTRPLVQALEWSWGLLTEHARRVLMQISTFRGGFDLNAAAAVTSVDESTESISLLDLLSSLQRDNLLRSEHRADGDTRYHLYGSIRSFAEQKLKAGGGANLWEAAVARHGAYYARYGSEDVIDTLDLAGSARERAALILEIANLREAATRATAVADAAHCAIAVCAVIDLQGPLNMGTKIIEVLLDRSDMSDFHRMRLAPFLSRFQERSASRIQRLEVIKSALQTAREWKHTHYEGVLLRCLGGLHHAQGQYDEAKDCYRSALEAHTLENSERLRAIVLCQLGNLEWRQGDLGMARTHLAEALRLSTAAGDQRHAALAHLNLGRLAAIRGNRTDAHQHLEHALQTYRDIGYIRFEAQTLNALANLYMDGGEARLARDAYTAAMALHQRSGSEGLAAIVSGNLGELLLSEGQLIDAAQALRSAVHICDRTYPSAGAQFKGLLALALARQGQFDEARVLCDAAEAFLLDAGQRPALGKQYCYSGNVYAELGDRTRAHALCADAEAILVELGAGVESELGQAVADLKGLLA